jgi:hypothetical protein
MQNAFFSEIDQNNFFIFKKLFLISTHQNNLITQKKTNFKQKKKINFF